MKPLIVDLFAGGGGASTGIAQSLGRDPDIAVNHSPAAIAMHLANHPHTRHLCESVWSVDPRQVCGRRPVGLLWASPDCTHFSRAKGGKPRSKGIRSLAHVVIEWARAVRPQIILLENVEEFATWGPLLDDGKPCPARRGETFAAWRAQLHWLGYSVEWRSLVAADYGAPTTRKRLFLVARCDGLPIVWPEPTHGAGRAHPWRAAAEVIDWSIPCPSIFGRKKPLAEATLRRIARGIQRYVIGAARPFIVPVTHPSDSRVHGIDEPMRTVTAANRGEFALVQPFASSQFGQPVGRALTEPLPTVTAGGGGHHALVAPALIQTGYGERDGQAPRALDIEQSLGTVVAGGAKHALVSAFLARHYGGHENDGSPLNRPTHTVTCQDHHALTVAHLAKLYGTSTGSDVREPAPTVTAGGGHLAEVRAFLVKYYGTGAAAGLGDPLDTVTTRDRFGLVQVAGETYEIADIGMRMLQPRELFAAQGFPDSYEIAPLLGGKPLTKTQQIELAGNSVCPPVAAALVRANVEARTKVAA